MRHERWIIALLPSRLFTTRVYKFIHSFTRHYLLCHTTLLSSPKINISSSSSTFYCHILQVFFTEIFLKDYFSIHTITCMLTWQMNLLTESFQVGFCLNKIKDINLSLYYNMRMTNYAKNIFLKKRS